MADRLLVYVVAGTLIGARFFDVVFYQHFREILRDPLACLYFWEGGLASHGGVCGILVALYLFVKKERLIGFLNLVDVLVIPACFAAVFIRFGNFINQEILGKPTELPFGIIFLHPADGSLPVPRHPVQLYEALFYLCLGAVLWKAQKWIRIPGRLGALFFILCFGFRFLIEGLKEEQSAYFSPDALLTMGQALSVPLFLFGVWLYFSVAKRSASSTQPPPNAL